MAKFIDFRRLAAERAIFGYNAQISLDRGCIKKCRFVHSYARFTTDSCQSHHVFSAPVNLPIDFIWKSSVESHQPLSGFHHPLSGACEISSQYQTFISLQHEKPRLLQAGVQFEMPISMSRRRVRPTFNGRVRRLFDCVRHNPRKRTVDLALAQARR